MGIPVMSESGAGAVPPVVAVSPTSTPLPLNVRVPVARIPLCGVVTGGVPEVVGLRSVEGMLRLYPQVLAPVLVNVAVRVWLAPSES